MTKNETLTDLLQGNTITAIAQTEEGKLEIGFDNGTWIAAKTEPGTVIDSSTPTGGVVEAVHQDAQGVSLELTSGESLDITTPAGTPPGAAVVAVK